VRTEKRTEPPHEADERATLSGFLQYQRETLAWKCSDLTVEQLREKGVPPSGLSLLGLIRHVAEVERSWLGNVFMGDPDEPFWDDGPDADFEVEGADAEEALRAWRGACARSREIVEGAASLDAVGHHKGMPFSLRWILTHMIEEYARHNGHADLLRERIDGATGE
jgi:uncharacterized damage-inducible protein DinB